MLIHKDKKALILRVRNTNVITSVIPKSKVFEHNGKEYVAVKHGPEEVQVLRNLGIDAPSPTEYYYDWPGQYAPFEHQRDVVGFLATHNRVFNLCGMGSGKTLATLWAYDFLRGCKTVNRAVVVTPLSTLERTWGDELFNHFPHLSFSVLHGSRERRLKLLDQEADIYLINHDGVKVKGFVEALAKRGDIDLLIIDELAQVARNAGTDRFRALMTIANRQTPRRVWGLTGTPTPNAPTDAWAQCRLLVPENVPIYFNRFKDQVMRQVSQFVWVPRPNALEVVHNAMQPSIRYSLEECIDLPPCVYEYRTAELTPTQTKAYKEMMARLKVEADAGEVLAVNEAVKAQKLIQISCISYNTPVLTSDGWIPIQKVTSSHKVWDGEEWVSQLGAANMGNKKVTECFGVRMTDDHRVLTVSGWATAREVLDEQAKTRSRGSSSERFNREHVRLPDGYSARGVYRQNRGVVEADYVAVPVRMREGGRAGESIPQNEAQTQSEELRVPSRERDTQNVEHATVPYLVRGETPLLERVRQGLEKLRRAGYHNVRTLAGILRKFLGRHGFIVPARAHAGAPEQRRAVFSGELQVGNANPAGEQYEKEPLYRHAEREADNCGSCAGVWPEESYAGGSPEPVPMVSGESTVNSGDIVPVYDLINSGPRNRFVVRGRDMRPLIVHNCGCAYGTDGEEVVFDAGNRLELVKEVVEESGTKVIVFVPFVAVIRHVAAFLRKSGYSVECIYGEVSKKERDRIFTDFQKHTDPHIIVAQPAAMSHGLTLTAASTIIWYSPIPSNDIFEQANARIVRPGQKHKQLIVMIEGTDIEARYYKRLKEKQKVQGLLLDMIQESR